DSAQTARSTPGTAASSSEPAFFSGSSSPEIHSTAAWRSTVPEARVLEPNIDADFPSVRHRVSSDDGASDSAAHGSCGLQGHTAATASGSAGLPSAQHGSGRQRSWHWGSTAERSADTSQTDPSQ